MISRATPVFKQMASAPGRMFFRGFAESTKKSVKSLTQADIEGKVVFVRADLNVPVTKEGEVKVTDDTRIVSSIPTIKELQSLGAKTVVTSHMGRPKGKVNERMRLAPIAQVMAQHLGSPVTAVSDCIGESVRKACQSMRGGDVVLLENLRFHAGETKNEEAFSARLASDTGAMAYVNDAFGTAHRAHSSTAGVVEQIKALHPGAPAVSGLLLEKEIAFLHSAVTSPVRPFAAIVGGAKVSTKITVLESLMDKCEKVLVSGGMIFTFLKARGHGIGSSIVENDCLELAAKLEETAKAKGVELLLPTDVVIADKFDSDANTDVVSVESIPDGWMGLDHGPETCSIFRNALSDCKTVVWNGPMGAFEMEKFANGTNDLALCLAELTTSKGATTIVGGGDSVAAVKKCGLEEQLSHISTGGGASLEMLEGKTLPGVAALDDK
eukprot:CAMPEP_0185279112 /NCGR_PEP_ID=MMETSP1359-20130426/62729_1 /TAXON_ID=552665 /ORGANISM="Bigelowiella longifila, Strain CCMP242" /LENGTH=438 /DNA_ID=CAMNT_0027873883 /DNA_START=131 /DNA_END=1447 /DNA_ORIENTATION=-